MQTFFFAIIIISTLAISSFQYADAERGRDYNDVINPDGTHTWTGNLPEYVLDSDGQWKPQITKTNSTHINILSEQFPVSFNKNQCTLTIYNKPDGNPLNTLGVFIEKEKWTLAWNTNNTGWNVFNNPESLGCAWNTFTNATGKYLEVIRIHPKGVMTITYGLVDGKYIKPSLTFTNNGDGFTDTKVSFVNQWVGVDLSSLFAGTKINTDIIPAGTTRTFSFSEIPKQFIDFNNRVGNTFFAHLQEGFDDLLAVQITKRSDGKFDINFAYGRSRTDIQPGETVYLDPVFGYSGGTAYEFRTTSATGAACPTAAGGTVVSVGSRFLQKPGSGFSNYCAAIETRVDISSIPPGVIVTNTTIRADVDSVASSIACDINAVQFDPSTASAETGWNDATNGTTFVNADLWCTTDGNDKELDLGSSADTDIQTDINSGQGWWSWSYAYDDFVRDATNRSQRHANGALSNELQVTYTGRPNAVTDLAALTITGTSVVLDWTQPALNGGNLSGYQINYTTPWGLPATVVTNNTGNSQSTGTVSGLTELTQYSFRVSAWTESGNNATGNIVNTTTLKDFSVGSLDFNATNTSIIPIRYQRNNINTTSAFLNITYNTGFVLSCDLDYRYAMTNQTYGNITSTTSGGFKHSAFQFNGLDNEVVYVFCWDQNAGAMNSTLLNSTNSGKFIMTQTDFLIKQQVADFRSGTFGTAGQIGVFDVITLVGILLSMVGLNRVNETVGAIFSVAIIAVLAMLGIIEWPTIIASSIALVVLVAVTTTKKD